MPQPFFHTVCTISIFVLCCAVLGFNGCTVRKIDTPSSIAVATSHSASSVNINQADRDLLQTLPQVGPTLADKIIDHRTRYGPFRKTEHLLLVEGISETRFNATRHLITVE